MSVRLFDYHIETQSQATKSTNTIEKETLGFTELNALINSGIASLTVPLLINSNKNLKLTKENLEISKTLLKTNEIKLEQYTENVNLNKQVLEHLKTINNNISKLLKEDK